MPKRDVEEMRSELFYMMEACNECHGDSPDGAWLANMESCVEDYNKMYRRHGANFEPNQSVQDWLKWREKEMKAGQSA